ncbi:MAG TPA: hypothetical protein VMQ83_08795 [Gammaproteobacteria bacterium]|nr:hypothetical protein [Gammaproteobacteria bacterium]
MDDLFVDPLPHKRCQRITRRQFHAIHAVAPQWLCWLMTLAVHLALRRIDFVNLRFDDVAGGRMEHPAQVLPEYAAKAFARKRGRRQGEPARVPAQSPEDPSGNVS